MKTIALYPWSNRYLNNKIFESNYLYNLFAEENVYDESNPFRLLKRDLETYGYNLVTIDKIDNLDDAEYILFFDMPPNDNQFFQQCLAMNLFEKMILFLWEPKVVKPENYAVNSHMYFKRIFTWNDELVDRKKYYKFNFPEPSRIHNPYKKNFQQKKFCTLIAGNKRSLIENELYSERIQAIKYFEKNAPSEFEYYGRGWYGPKNILKYAQFIPFIKKKCYKGEAANKLKTLSEYKFCICYENQKNVKGYITEKIFDCFFAGTIPVYLGADNVSDYIPEGCYIDRRNFANNKELHYYLTTINEEEYNRYLSNIQSYLLSEPFFQFTDRAFAENIIRILVKQGDQ
ncbi:glycosyltransferase family 10 domain-containing protein [Cohnella caldifontis]|uniref:glycosyltransferase family 10 domain-containing protein n=1 Tax=Cohnella caldifontis TaxID=3027471 RepID=UPI0023EBB578|nr:glycosyltransferase family 10 [Cohnella sp. YIM B05605]